MDAPPQGGQMISKGNGFGAVVVTTYTTDTSEYEYAVQLWKLITSEAGLVCVCGGGVSSRFGYEISLASVKICNFHSQLPTLSTEFIVLN